MARTILTIDKLDSLEALAQAIAELQTVREVRAFHPSEIYLSHGSAPELFTLRLVELDMGDGSHVYNVSIEVQS